VVQTKRKFSLDKRSFVAGLLVGSLFVLALVATFAGVAAVRGATVSLDSKQLAVIVRDRIVAQAKTEIPKVIEGAKAEIPAIVEKEMRTRIVSDRMEIAGFVFRMPAEFIEQLNSKMRKNVENAAGEIMDGIDTDQLAEKFGAEAYLLVQEALQDELAGQTFRVMVFNRIPVRVNVEIK
jgi:hypothetical protein